MDDVKNDIQGSIEGRVRIKIHFKNRIMWQRYRKYILKTNWDFNELQHPYLASLDEEFHNMDDVERITKLIIFLLHLGFDIHSVHWHLIQNDDESCVETTFSPDLWKKSYEELEDAEG